jgi:tetratricopeptide (TPR) repeat protein
MSFSALWVPAIIAGLAAGPTAMPVDLAQENAETLFREAKALRYAQKWFEATAVYHRLLKDFPKSPRAPEARYWLAFTLQQDQRWDEASAAYTEFLTLHRDQALLGKEAKLNRIQCWGVRQGQSPDATPGLLHALEDDRDQIRVAAALQLAKRRDSRAVSALQVGLRLPASADACRVALASMGVKPDFAETTPQGRFLVLKIQERGKEAPIVVRVAMGLARAIGSYLSDEQLREAKAKGIDMERIMDQALTAPKGTELFSLDDGKSKVVLTVE